MRNNASRPTLLIHNLFNYGHFLVYADTLTKWALSRGWRTVLMGRGLGRTAYARRYAGNPDVSLRDSDPGCHMDQNQADMFKVRIVEPALDELLEAQTALRPQISILLTTDELIFRSERLRDEGFRFPSPTVGLVTFGHRDHYLGFKDCYARRLDRILATRRPFSRILTLDEFQVAFHDPGQEYLIFLPDIYAGPEADPDEPPIADQTAEDAPDLAAFLDAAQGPVLPVLGKIDRRKNSSWVLRMARDIPNARCVLLGERVPGPDDAEFDGPLNELRTQGRAFERFGYVPERWFRQTLLHPATTFVPLPYSCHYGSSGIQLQAFAAGKPTLVPDVGLMALRTSAHGLGACFAAGDEEDFRSACAVLLEQGAAPYADNLRRFMRRFTREERFAQLDRAFGLAPAPGPGAQALASGPPTAVGETARAMGELLAGKAQAALNRLDALQGAGAPLPDAPLLLRRALVLDALGRHAESAEAARRAIERGGGEEFALLLRARVDESARLQRAGKLAAALTSLCAALVAALPLLAPREQSEGPNGVAPTTAAATDPDTLMADALAAHAPLDAARWSQAGGVLAQNGRHDAAVACFRRAIELAPRIPDYRLNLSDALRYAKRLDEAWDTLLALQAIAPDQPGLRHKRGQVLFERGDLAAARVEFLLEPATGPFAAAARGYLDRMDERR